MRIAVIGAGIFGTTIALKLCKDHQVTLFEKNDDIMTAASRTNQLRLHRGYHYPRSPDTVKSLLESIQFFVEEYREAVVDEYDHFYAIASENSLVTSDQYINFCDHHNLEYEIIDKFEWVNNEKIDLTVKVKESLLDYQEVYHIIKSRIEKSRLETKFKTEFNREIIDNFDLVVNATYADINDILLNQNQKQYQFEVCEKIAVEMPDEMKEKSIVVMDGPFMCVDPYGRSGLSLLGNVVHAIHHTNTGIKPVVPSEIKSYLNKGLVKNPSITKFSSFVETGSEYIPEIKNAVYRGSMFTVRAVLPNMDKTDGRPTVIGYPEEKVVNVFSGKIDTCVKAANDLVERLSE